MCFFLVVIMVFLYVRGVSVFLIVWFVISCFIFVNFLEIVVLIVRIEYNVNIVDLRNVLRLE